MTEDIKKKSLWKIILLLFYATLLFFVLFVFLQIIIILPSAIEQAHRRQARSYMSHMRHTCEYYFNEDGNVRRCTSENLGIDAPGTDMCGTCGPSNSFSYSVQDLGKSKQALTATRCVQAAAPPRERPYRLTLTADYACETGDTCDTWDSE